MYLNCCVCFWRDPSCQGALMCLCPSVLCSGTGSDHWKGWKADPRIASTGTHCRSASQPLDVYGLPRENFSLCVSISVFQCLFSISLPISFCVCVCVCVATFKHVSAYGNLGVLAFMWEYEHVCMCVMCVCVCVFTELHVYACVVWVCEYGNVCVRDRGCVFV
mgnify:CR=1 FL=1